MYHFLVDQSCFSVTWFCYLHRFSIQIPNHLLWYVTFDCSLFSRLFNFFCPLANFLSSLFYSFLNSFLFFLLPTRRDGHRPTACQKHYMTCLKFLQPIIHILNLIAQMNKFELNKDMHILGQKSLFIYNINPFGKTYAKLCVKIKSVYSN